MTHALEVAQPHTRYVQLFDIHLGIRPQDSYRKILERPRDKQTAREMALEALFEDAYHDSLE